MGECSNLYQYFKIITLGIDANSLGSLNLNLESSNLVNYDGLESIFALGTGELADI